MPEQPSGRALRRRNPKAELLGRGRQYRGRVPAIFAARLVLRSCPERRTVGYGTTSSEAGLTSKAISFPSTHNKIVPSGELIRDPYRWVVQAADRLPTIGHS